MKIQCSCGTKYAFDVTPEMLANPVKLVCQNCGADNSAAVNELIRQQFGREAETGAAASSAQVDPRVSGPQMCGKHPAYVVSEHCVVCSKPICAKCMELFGYVCSPLCKAEAESRRIHVPAYAGQGSARQAASWRRFRLVSWGIAVLMAGVVGLWIWYSVSLSKPRPIFAVRFDEAANTGNARFVTDTDAIVLHGGRLMRYDLKGKRELWHSDLIDKADVAQQAAKIAASEKAAFEKLKASQNYTEQELRRRQPEAESDIARRLETGAADAMQLYIRGTNLWVRSAENLARYEFENGKLSQTVPLTNGYAYRVLDAEDSLVVIGDNGDGETATRLDLTSGQSETFDFPAERPSMAASLATTPKGKLPATANRVAAPIKRSAQSGSTLAQFKTRRDPNLPEQLAAPAVAASQLRNAQVENAMKDDSPAMIATPETGSSLGRIVVSPSGKVFQMGVRLLEQKTVERQAMKAPPKKSALDGAVNQASTADVANELFNEAQRERTGGVEKEDVSRFEVSLKRGSSSAADWVGEVTGPPSFFTLQTVNLLVADKTLQVFDQSNRKLWESKLNYRLGEVGEVDDDFFGAGAGAPAVEHGKDLLFRDAGVLTCFDLATGNARWRLPSVGVRRLLFDDAGMLYAETTTAAAEKLKYSQQVDVSRKVHPLIIKIDPANGKLLWASENNGRLAHVSGKLIYTLEWQGGVETGEENPYGIPGTYVPPHVRIRRLSPRTGQAVWEHYQRRGPLDVRFHESTIEILFRKEFQVLHFWTSPVG